MLNYEIIDTKVTFRITASEDEIYLVGSFTNWLVLEEFKMRKVDTQFIIEKDLDELKKIGNSGYIEYYFGNKQKKLAFDTTYPKGYYFNNQANKDFNYLLLPNDISPNEVEEIIEASENSFIIKNKPEDFKDYEELTNFRQINGGDLSQKKLFRSYHPAVKSRQENDELRDIELIRQQVLLDLLEKNEINTIINLSETEEKLKNYIDSMNFNYYKKLYIDNKIFNVPMAYETVYFMSSENKSFNPDELGFQDGLKKIIKIIAENQGPYLVHCRLGSDRTGVVSAFLQLFMGSSKDIIKENYERTNNLGIGEYRSFKLLEFSLKSTFGENFYNNKEYIWRYLENLGLEREFIDNAYNNLKK